MIVCGLMMGLDHEESERASERARESSLEVMSDWQCGDMMWPSEAILSVMRHDDTGMLCCSFCLFVSDVYLLLVIQ
ncbi:unnamed protein product [Schistosoma bovis]|nr:unnamed protein product [Schistosoma bovis]